MSPGFSSVGLQLPPSHSQLLPDACWILSHNSTSAPSAATSHPSLLLTCSQSLPAAPVTPSCSQLATGFSSPGPQLAPSHPQLLTSYSHSSSSRSQPPPVTPSCPPPPGHRDSGVSMGHPHLDGTHPIPGSRLQSLRDGDLPLPAVTCPGPTLGGCRSSRPLERTRWRYQQAGGGQKPGGKISGVRRQRNGGKPGPRLELGSDGDGAMS